MCANHRTTMTVFIYQRIFDCMSSPLAFGYQLQSNVALSSHKSHLCKEACYAETTMKCLELLLVVALVAGQVPAWRINENDSPLEIIEHTDITIGGDVRETARHAPDELTSSQDNIRGSAYDEKFRNFLENLRIIIRDGNETLSIPPLDPFEEELLELDLDEQYVTGSLKFTDFEAQGLAGYRVDKAEVVLFPPKLTVGLTWPRLHSSGSYELNAVALKNIEAYGKGNYTVTATDLSFETKIFLRLKPLSIKKMETQVSLGGLAFSATGLFNDEYTSMILSNVISDVVPELIQEHHHEVTTEINEKVMAFANKKLEGMTMNQLLALLS